MKEGRRKNRVIGMATVGRYLFQVEIVGIRFCLYNRDSNDDASLRQRRAHEVQNAVAL